MGLSLAEDRTEPKLTVAQDAIEGADAYTSNAVLPTYSELLAALRVLVDQSGAAQGMPAHAPRPASVHAARALLTRHDRTMRGDFRA